MRGRTVVVLVALVTLVAGCESTGEVTPQVTTSSVVQPDATEATAAPAPTTIIPGTTSPPTTLPTTAAPTTAFAQPQPHWITVESGVWVDRRTGTEFVPRGVNLLRKKQRSGDFLFADYDPTWVDQQLDDIAGLGFNTVRFFLDLCMRCTTTDSGLIDAYLDNLADLLQRMADRGLAALPTSNDVPDPGYSNRLPCCELFGGYRNSLYLTVEGHAIAVEYFTDLITGLQERRAPLHAVLGWQLANEQFFLRDIAPISLRSGSVTTADGETYDLTDDAAVRTMLESNLLAYISVVDEAIRGAQRGQPRDERVLLVRGTERRTRCNGQSLGATDHCCTPIRRRLHRLARLPGLRRRLGSHRTGIRTRRASGDPTVAWGVWCLHCCALQFR